MAIIMYNGRGSDEYRSEDGGKTFTNQRTGEVTSGSSLSTSSSKSSSKQSSGWNTYEGKTGKTYDVAGSNGTIKVTYADGSSRTVLPTDSDYAATQKAMQTDIQANGGSYTPSNTYTNSNGTYTTKDYTSGNNDLKYALEQAAKEQPGISLTDYVISLYNRVGSTRSNGTVVTIADVDKELDRLGLSDYNSQNAIYTVGGNLLPGNSLVEYENGNGEVPTNSADSLWASYGGMDYLIGGTSADYAQYAAGKAGNLSNLDYIFGNMADNQYAQQDPEFLAQFNQNKSELETLANALAGSSGTTDTTGTAGTTGTTGLDSYLNALDKSWSDYGNQYGGVFQDKPANSVQLGYQGYADQLGSSWNDFKASNVPTTGTTGTPNNFMSSYEAILNQVGNSWNSHKNANSKLSDALNGASVTGLRKPY